MEMTAPGVSLMTQKIWIKKNKMRTEMTTNGVTVITLIDQDANVMYTYMPAEKIAMKTTLNNTAPVPATDKAQSVESYSPKIVGTEIADGKVCLVVEYTADGTVTRMWIWKDRGFPVKVEATGAEGKTLIEYKNYDFGDIADSMFELPAGVQIIAM
jgi:outer membrane lipoprotein-sorting protein